MFILCPVYFVYLFSYISVYHWFHSE